LPAGILRSREQVRDWNEALAVGVVDGPVEALVEADDHGQNGARRHLRKPAATQVPTALRGVVERPAEVLPGAALVERAQQMGAAVRALPARAGAVRQDDRAVAEAGDPGLARMAVRIVGRRLVHHAQLLDVDAHLPSFAGWGTVPLRQR